MDIVAAIKKSDLFNSVEDMAIASIQSQFIEKKYLKNQFVFQQWDEADRLYIILSGLASIQMHGMDGKDITIATLHPGSIFGEFALIDDQARSASVIIDQDAKIASMSKTAFKNLIETNQIISKNMLKHLIGHLRKSNDQMESLVNLTLSQRTAKILLELYEKEGRVINVTQKKLSERLFASREKVNASLKALENQGSIKRGHRKIEIISVEGLSQLQF